MSLQHFSEADDLVVVVVVDHGATQRESSAVGAGSWGRQHQIASDGPRLRDIHDLRAK